MLYKESLLIRGNGASSRMRRDAVVLAALNGAAVVCVSFTGPTARNEFTLTKHYLESEIEATGVSFSEARLRIDFETSGGSIRFIGERAVAAVPSDAVVLEDRAVAQKRLIDSGTHQYVERSILVAEVVPVTTR